MAINNLYSTYTYKRGNSDMPIVIFTHGFTGFQDDFTQAMRQRFADYGLFCMFPNMRGRVGAGGTADASGLEINDLYDALVYVRANFPGLVSAIKAAIVGYSGGGGNALAAACKLPDYFGVIVSHFGMSDYGFDGTYGWYQQQLERQATLESWIGGDPTTLPGSYRSRNAVEAITNYGGELYLYHDVSDGSVQINHSERVGDARPTTHESYTSGASMYRWSHGYPANGSDLSHTEDTWVPAVLGMSAWQVPASGTHRVIGWMRNSRYFCKLGDGKSHVADVSYGAVADHYVVTPLTGIEVSVTVTQGAKTVTQTIDAETDLTVV